MRNVYGWSLVAVLGLSGIAPAQNARIEDEPAVPRRPAAGKTGDDIEIRSDRRTTTREIDVDVAAGRTASGDQQLAFCLHGACKNEIAIATFAQDRLQTEAAKEFAAKLMREHSAGCEKLAQIAGNLVDRTDEAAPGADRPAAAPRRESGEGEEPAAPRAGVKVDAGAVEVQAEGARRPGARPAADVEVRAGAAGGQLDWIAIQKELGQRCLESTKKELAKHEGMDFDQGFMGQQLMAHIEMVDKLTVFKSHASPQLRQIIESELQVATNHLNEARQIMEQMKDTETPPRTARRPGAPAPEGRPAPKTTPERRPE